MPDTPKYWSNNPNAPQFPYLLYLIEKTNLAGFLIGAILYGVASFLFIQCMHALLNPTNRRKGAINWVIVAHTVAMFSFLTIPFVENLNVLSAGYVDNRAFRDSNDAYPEPLDWEPSNYLGIVAPMFPLNQWLGDGLLLFRCYAIYAVYPWATVIPCLMYLTSVGTGILYLYEAMQPSKFIDTHVDIGLVYFAISLSLNVLLTLMIVGRLLLHRRNIRNAIGASDGFGGLYAAIATMVIESAAIYAITYLIYIAAWAADNYMETLFSPILPQTAVIAPFLITFRVAKQRAVTNEMITSGNIDPIHFKSYGGSTGGGETHTDRNYTSSADMSSGQVADEISLESKNAIEEVRS